MDPWASKEEVNQVYGLELKSSFSELDAGYEAIILAVSHHQFIGLDLKGLKADHGVIFDVKALLPKDGVDARL
jgi:UDP-N-acetyl-D-galactosamine dehydrogenase